MFINFEVNTGFFREKRHMRFIPSDAIGRFRYIVVKTIVKVKWNG